MKERLKKTIQESEEAFDIFCNMNISVGGWNGGCSVDEVCSGELSRKRISKWFYSQMVRVAEKAWQGCLDAHSYTVATQKRSDEALEYMEEQRKKHFDLSATGDYY